MNTINKIKDALCKMNKMLTKQQKRYGFLVLLMTLFAAILETLGISAILPVIDALLDLEALSEKWYVKPIAELLSIDNSYVLVMLICGSVILIYVVKNLYFIFYSWVLRKYGYKVKRELGIKVMEAYMRQGYIFFVNHNSGRLMNGIVSDVDGVYGLISQLFNIATKVLTIVLIAAFIIVQSPFIALFLLVLSVVCIIIIQVTYRKALVESAEMRRKYAWNNTQTVVETIQGIKEVLVANRQHYFVEKYEKSLIQLNDVAIKLEMATINPVYVIEMISVAGLLMAIPIQAYIVEDATKLIASLSIVAVSAFRILPAVGAITSSINQLMSSMPAFNAAYETICTVKELEKEQKENINIEKVKNIVGEKHFNSELILDDIVYKYPNTESFILKHVNLKIKAKSSVGIIGASGAGKTTLVDILLGLLHPCNGTIMLDGVEISELGDEWNRIIGYVPQNVFLFDASIKANIAFGIPDEEIDDDKVWKALQMAQLDDFVKTLPKQIDTKLGERGVRFSGGQRQRVAIARALYHNPDILVLDEATAALDNDTEAALLEAIESLQGHKTLIIVAHRLTTIKKCDYIYEVKDGKVIERSQTDVFGE